MSSTQLHDDKKKTSVQEHDTDLNLYLFGNRVRKEKKKKVPFYNEYESYKNYCKKRDRVILKKKSNYNFT